jgi:hypothetical protein
MGKSNGGKSSGGGGGKGTNNGGKSNGGNWPSTHPGMPSGDGRGNAPPAK